MKDVVFFLAKPKNNDIKAQISEISEIKWVKYHDAIKMINYDADKSVLREAFEDIKRLI